MEGIFLASVKATDRSWPFIGNKMDGISGRRGKVQLDPGDKSRAAQDPPGDELALDRLGIAGGPGDLAAGQDQEESEKGGFNHCGGLAGGPGGPPWFSCLRSAIVVNRETLGAHGERKFRVDQLVNKGGVTLMDQEGVDMAVIIGDRHINRDLWRIAGGDNFERGG
jgi:hypothetical protein